MKKDGWVGLKIRIGKVHRVKDYSDGGNDCDAARGYTYCGIQVGPAVLSTPGDLTCKPCIKACAKKSQNEGSAK